MDTNATLRITLVSGACCVPHLARLDKALAENVRQAIERVGAEAEVRTVSLGAVLGGEESLSAQQRQQVLSLFQKYGARLAPAVLIGEQVRFAGAVPGVDQLKEAFAAATQA